MKVPALHHGQLYEDAVGVEAYLHTSLALGLDGSEWPASRPGRLHPGEYPLGSNQVGFSAGLGAGSRTHIILSPS
jgi:hypothetical protein